MSNEKWLREAVQLAVQSIHRLFIDAEPISYICSGGLHGNKAQEGQPCLNILRRIFLDIGTSQCLNGRQFFDQCMFFDHFLYFGSDLRFSRTRCPSQLRQPGPDRSPLRRRRRRIPYSLLPDNCRSAARHPAFPEIVLASPDDVPPPPGSGRAYWSALTCMFSSGETYMLPLTTETSPSNCFPLWFLSLLSILTKIE